MRTLFVAVTVVIATSQIKTVDNESCRKYVVRSADHKTKNVWILESEKWEKGDTVNISLPIFQQSKDTIVNQ